MESTREFIESLEKSFRVNGFPIIDSISVMERESLSFIDHKFYGGNLLSLAFQEFFAETINDAFNKYNLAENKFDPSKYYVLILCNYLTCFKSFRSSSHLYQNGYPFDGYSLLRDLKDQAIFTSAIIQNRSTFREIYGFDEHQMDDDPIQAYYKRTKRRKSVQNGIMEQMFRKNSKLSEKYKNDLLLWDKLFHEEVHGSGLTYAFEMKDIAETNRIDFGPKLNEKYYSMFLNRLSEIEWLFLRCLPFLQLEPNNFGETWNYKWEILDRAYLYMVNDLKLDIAYAIIDLVDVEFNYHPNRTSYSQLLTGSE